MANKRVLMVAFHFPPLSFASGIQRTLRFVQHLPGFGWDPIVLSATPNAYESTSDDLLGNIPEGVTVRRAFALDTARHLGFKRRYLQSMARPDRWVTWRFDGVRQGMKLIESFRPDVIWSTFPIATALLIGRELHRRTGIPWIADFRDPMPRISQGPDPDLRKMLSSIEDSTLEESDYCVYTTPGAVRIHSERHARHKDKLVLIENGYDEESFAGLAPTPSDRSARRRLVLLHSGFIYPSGRDPSHLLAAVKRLLDNGSLQRNDLLVRFRDTTSDDSLRSMIAAQGLQDVVELCPPIPYLQALEEMQSVDALLILQSAVFNNQIPAKLYEYFRARRPILALTDGAGDTAALVRASGSDAIAPLDSADQIAAVLPGFLAAVRDGSAAIPDDGFIASCSRRQRAGELASLLDKARNNTAR